MSDHAGRHRRILTGYSDGEISDEFLAYVTEQFQLTAEDLKEVGLTDDLWS